MQEVDFTLLTAREAAPDPTSSECGADMELYMRDCRRVRGGWDSENIFWPPAEQHPRALNKAQLSSLRFVDTKSLTRGGLGGAAVARSVAPTGDLLSMPRMVFVPVQNTPTPFTNTRARRVSEVLRVSTALRCSVGMCWHLEGGDREVARASSIPTSRTIVLCDRAHVRTPAGGRGGRRRGGRRTAAAAAAAGASTATTAPQLQKRCSPEFAVNTLK